MLPNPPSLKSAQGLGMYFSPRIAGKRRCPRFIIQRNENRILRTVMSITNEYEVAYADCHQCIIYVNGIRAPSTRTFVRDPPHGMIYQIDLGSIHISSPRPMYSRNLSRLMIILTNNDSSTRCCASFIRFRRSKTDVSCCSKSPKTVRNRGSAGKHGSCYPLQTGAQTKNTRASVPPLCTILSRPTAGPMGIC